MAFYCLIVVYYNKKNKRGATKILNYEEVDIKRVQADQKNKIFYKNEGRVYRKMRVKKVC